MPYASEAARAVHLARVREEIACLTREAVRVRVPDEVPPVAPVPPEPGKVLPDDTFAHWNTVLSSRCSCGAWRLPTWTLTANPRVAEKRWFCYRCGYQQDMGAHSSQG